MKNRKDRYLSSLANGYLLLIIQVVVSLIQVPLALDYIGKEEFGLWALTAQIALWFQLLDLGMNGAVARHLIDYVGGKDPDNLNRCLATGFRILAGQGFIVVLVTLVLAAWGASLFGLSGDDVAKFRGILLILGLTSFVRFSYKILSAWLYSLQRLDVISGMGTLLVVSELAMFWWMLGSGFGIYALAWAKLGATMLGGLLYVVAVSRVTAFPWRALVAPFDRRMFGKLAVFGGGMFALTLGSQLLLMSQTALVSSRLGLAAAAIWATAPKVFMLASQALSKLWDYRIPHLSLLMTEGKKHEIFTKFRSVFKSTAYLGGGVTGGLAAVNPAFLEVWTGGVIHWPFVNDLLMGMTVYSAILIRCFTDFVLHTKKVGWMPILMVAEGVAFVLLALWILPIYGLSGMLVTSLAIGGILRLPYALKMALDFLDLGFNSVVELSRIVVEGAIIGIVVWMLVSLPSLDGLIGSNLGCLVAQSVVLAALLLPLVWKLVIRAEPRDFIEVESKL